MSAITSFSSLAMARTHCACSSSSLAPRAVSLSRALPHSNIPAVLKARAVVRGVSAARVSVTPVLAKSVGRVRISVKGKDLQVTEAINEYVQQKVGNALEPFEEALRVREVDVKVTARGGEGSKGEKMQTVECTVYTKKHVFRAEDSEENLYAGIDKVADKLARKLRKTKERSNPKGAKTAREMQPDDSPLETPGINAQASLPKEVIRTKYFTMPGMSVEAAIQNLEMIDHDFYAFTEAKSGKINVVYKRKAGDYGLIVPMVADEE